MRMAKCSIGVGRYGNAMTFRCIIRLCIKGVPAVAAKIIVVSMVLVVLLSGCGGADTENKEVGGVDPSGNPGPALNQVPTAIIEAPLNVPSGSNIELSAAKSSDPEHRPLSYQWHIVKQPAGSVLTLSATTEAAIHITPVVNGEYTAQVTVSDGEKSNAAEFTFKVSTTKIRVSWNANVAKPDGYMVYVANNASMNDPKLMKTLSVSDSDWNSTTPQATFNKTDIKTLAGDNACFSVIAFNSGGRSELASSSCVAL